jgi:NitT/TauT family transport system substrate-binding protein
MIAGTRTLVVLAAIGLLVACAAPGQPPAAAPAGSGGGAAAPAAAGAPLAAPARAEPSPAAAAPPETVKIGYLGANMSNAGMFIAADKGYFQEVGIAPDLIPFDAGTRMVPALATNDIQVGAGSAGAGLFNTVHRGIHNKVVADKGSGPLGAGWQAMIVRKDLYDRGELTRLEDLRGKTFSVFTLEASQEVELAYHLGLVGLTLADVNILEIPSPDQPTAFANRTMDATWSIEPAVALLVDRGLAVRLFGSEERHPNQQTSTIMYSEQFANQRDLATRWMVAYLRGLRDYNDAFVAGRGREEIVQILERAKVVTDRALLERFGLTGLNPNGYVNRQSLQEMHDYFVRKGTITQPVALDDLVDDSFVTGALARIGVYDSPLYRDAVWLR